MHGHPLSQTSPYRDLWAFPHHLRTTGWSLRRCTTAMEEFTCSFVLHISPQRLSGSSIDSIDVKQEVKEEDEEASEDDLQIVAVSDVRATATKNSKKVKRPKRKSDRETIVFPLVLACPLWSWSGRRKPCTKNYHVALRKR